MKSKMILLAAIAIVGGLVPATATNKNALAGDARVVSVEPMLESAAQMCELPAPMSRAAYAAAQQMASAATTGGRAPLRAIADPYGTFSSIAVDPVNNEVVIQDENHYRVLIYDRTANTPPGAMMTQPKRIIAGDQTGML